MSFVGIMEIVRNTEYMERIKVIEKVNLIREIIKAIPGKISEKDGLFLYELAAQCSIGVIVEIGSFKGTSTACLAKGSKSSISQGHNVKVYSIEPHMDADDSQDPDCVPDLKHYTGQGKYFPEFKDMLKREKIDDIVVPIADYSELAYKNGLDGHEWNLPIELLFIDGDHRYNYVKKDLELWGKWVINGGIILMHDRPFPGVIKVIDTMVLENPRYSEIRDVDKSPIFNMIVADEL